ncbi:FtsX-like permease family protein [Bacteriovorax sp. PP10]|uniref:FtsX-like permease family protein n=1 Tax=Bacteriovorax antarcticus TaxID=3088717 RepID=A0ABU5VRY8_9BACT|nr:FtsX-like permease family protein [Bacteriovorax sp. PP10]MEA9355828.1 FtsX-like permease family protein [Bacteriovorax sp. PP10]
MWLVLKLAWRNIFRNKRRTILSVLAIGVGLAAMMFADALIVSLGETMVRSATEDFSGNAQIHQSEFVKNLEVEKVITNSEQILKDLKSENELQSFTPRVLSYGMLTSTSDANNIIVYGIDAEQEKGVSRISQLMVQGDYLNAQDDRKILIGKKLADNLNIGVGDRVVVTVAKSGLGELSQEMFRVGGIFAFGVREMDENVAFINLSVAQSILNLGSNIHEIALNFKDLNIPAKKHYSIATKYSKDGNVVSGWNKMFKDLAAILEFTQFSLGILAVILFGIIAFGIMNTLFMSLYERMFEFGVLRAVGTRPSVVARMILYEAFMMALVSTVVGVIIGIILIGFFSKYGIDYRGIEYAHLVFKDKIYPHFRLIQFTLYPVCLIVFATLVGIYPAIYAAKIIPAVALRKK